MTDLYSAKILVIEDDSDLGFIMKIKLKSKGYDVVLAANLKEIKDCLSASQYDLVILDMMLPDTDGINVCKQIRETSQCPILFVSCIVDRERILEAFSVGGDDYIVKPVDFEMLDARIKANLRRVGHTPVKSGITEFDSFIIDFDKHEVYLKDDTKVEIGLSPIEFKILEHFVKHFDELILYEDLYKEIWKMTDQGDVRTVMVHVSNLRKKLDPHNRDIIHTVRGAGYILSNR